MIIRRGICGHSSLVEYQLPKLRRRVRFPLSAPVNIKAVHKQELLFLQVSFLIWVV